MITYSIALAGIVVLIWVAVLVGVSMDTAAQRRQWNRTAEQRRLLREERLGVGFVARRCDPDALCAECPFR